MASPFIVAIDGPAGAGKSSVSKLLARRLGFALVDTGAIYRTVALAATRLGIGLDDDAKLGSLLAALHIRFEFVGEENRVFLADEDISAAIRTPEISKAASTVSARPVVRDGLLELQRRLARAAANGAVLEGRDIGTVVFPDAEVKFFLTASPEVRARRRHEELVAKGQNITFDETLADVKERDARDEGRAVAPLRQAETALLVDSTPLTIDETVAAMLAKVREVARR